MKYLTSYDLCCYAGKCSIGSFNLSGRAMRYFITLKCLWIRRKGIWMKIKMFTNIMSLKMTKILFIQGFLLSHRYNQQYAEGNVLFLRDLIYERRI